MVGRFLKPLRKQIKKPQKQNVFEAFLLKKVLKLRLLFNYDKV